MNAQLLIDTAKALVADDKDVLAMDESNPACNKRFHLLAWPLRARLGRALDRIAGRAIATFPSQHSVTQHSRLRAQPRRRVRHRFVEHRLADCGYYCRSEALSMKNFEETA